MTEPRNPDDCEWCGCPAAGHWDADDRTRDQSLWETLLRPDGTTFRICPWCVMDSDERQQFAPD